MENNLFVDTNILAHLLDGNERIMPFVDRKTIHISFITEMELLSKLYITKSEIQIINSLLENCVIYDFNHRIKNAAIVLMRNHRLKLADAVIAATSRYYGFILLTADKKFSSLLDCEVIKL
jgi:predicted nucleic acid-binding protein